ncbi:relaxase/mobilization nuclease domain-containing protein [Hyphomicrobium sp. CS1BSMeth3]|uniref:relaxase/mobilization nuclease domain-containing protein n=1 Tax=Hyphomicrobium sp. CS1BSMeth3 TaxID=1892844 RepID=UPI00092FF765|nr:relaxase/mobilization nuclease domain-containing protein [Hyphomicrobium sp. CS1BSMeth3]
MIAKKVAQGRGFRGALNYLLRGSKDATKGEAHRVAWMALRNLADPNPEHAPRLMQWTAQKSARVQTPLMHLIISWSRDENPTIPAIETLADAHLADIGLDRHQAILVVHEDKEHRHLHMLINRVHPHTGKAWSTSKDYARIEKSIGRLAKSHGFTFVPGRHNTAEARLRMPRRAKATEYRMQARTGRRPRARFSDHHISTIAANVGPLFAAARLEVPAGLPESLRVVTRREGEGAGSHQRHA